MTSTSKDITIAKEFVFGYNYAIIFDIEIDHENPHPFVDLSTFSEYDEKEILLFP